MSQNGFSRFVNAVLRRNKSGTDQQQRTDQQTSRPPALGSWLRWSPALGVAAVLIYAVGNDAPNVPFLRVLAVGLSVGAAASSVGALIGFLFGLPRTVDVTTGTASPAPARAALATNTNLEEISDWLTKILVGIGLVQLGAFVSQLSELGDSLAPGLGGGEGADAFAVGLVVYCLIDGFLLGYLWTRIVVSVRLRDTQRLLQASDEVLTTRLPPPPPAPAPAPPGTKPPEQPPPPDQQAEG